MSELSTARLTLRHWRAADAAPVAALNTDPELMQFLPGCLTRVQSDAFALQGGSGAAGLWAVGGGSARAHAVHRLRRPLSGEHRGSLYTRCGDRLAPGARQRGQGYATEAARECLRFAFEDLCMKSSPSRCPPTCAPGPSCSAWLCATTRTGTSSIRACRRGMRCGPTGSTPLSQERGRLRGPERRGRVRGRNSGISFPAAESSTSSAARRARVSGRCALITHQTAARRYEGI